MLKPASRRHRRDRRRLGAVRGRGGRDPRPPHQVAWAAPTRSTWCAPRSRRSRALRSADDIAGLPRQDRRAAARQAWRRGCARRPHEYVGAAARRRSRREAAVAAKRAAASRPLLRVTWVRSTIGHKAGARGTIRALGLHRLNQTRRGRRHARDPRDAAPRRLPDRGQRAGAARSRRRGGQVKLHDLHPTPGSHKPPRRVGRGHGSGRGKTAGRGTKGQKSRAGGSIPAWFEGGQTPLHVRTPKLHGFKQPLPGRVRAAEPRPARARSRRGTLVTPDVLRHDGLLRDYEDRPAGEDPRRRRRAERGHDPRPRLHALGARQARRRRQHGPAASAGRTARRSTSAAAAGGAGAVERRQGARSARAERGRRRRRCRAERPPASAAEPAADDADADGAGSHERRGGRASRATASESES